MKKRISLSTLGLVALVAVPAWANEDGHVPHPGFVGNPKVLSAPVVDSPLYVCGTEVSVRGAVPGATIELYLDGAMIQQAVTETGEHAFAVPALGDMEVVTAKQVLDGYSSKASEPVPVTSHLVNFPNGPPKPVIDTPLFECGGAVVAYSPMNGAYLSLNSEALVSPPSGYGTPGEIGAANGVGPSGKAIAVSPTLLEAARLSATAEICSELSDPSDYKIVLPDPGPLPAPTIGDVYPGQILVTVQGVTNGARVRIMSDGSEIGRTFGWKNGVVIRLDDPAYDGQALESSQELCTQPLETGSTEVKQCSQLAAPEVLPPQPEDELLELRNFVPGGRVTVFADTGVEIGDGSGPRVKLTRKLTAGEHLYVTQKVGECESANAYFVQVGCLPPGATQAYPCGSQPCARGQFPSSCWRPYGPESAFNKPIPPNPPLRPKSSEIRNRLFGDLSRTSDQPTDFWIPNDGLQGWPTYYGQSSDPLFTVQCNTYGPCDVTAFPGRAPAGAQNQHNDALMGDRHLTFIDQVSGIEYDLWQVTTNPLPSSGGDIQTGFSGYTMAMTGDGRSIGVGQGNDGQVGNLAGRIRAEELADAIAKNSYINHALAINVECTDGTVVYPGQERVGRICTDPDVMLPLENAPPMGGRLWLRMSFDQIEKLSSVPVWKKVILRTLSKYGAIIMDTGTDGAAFTWHREAGNQYTSMGVADAWLAVSASISSQSASWESVGNGYVGWWTDQKDGVDSWKETVWSNLEVVDACVSSGTCDEWYYRDDFRRLEEWTGGSEDLLTFVEDEIAHPTGMNYVAVPEGDPAFADFTSALIPAVRAAAANSSTSIDWCTASARASAAGYTLYRFRHGRTSPQVQSVWLVYARPMNADQAHFFFNPAAKRNLVIEVPHAGDGPGPSGEADVKEQGARVMLETSAFALLINGRDRCSQGVTACPVSSTATAVCGSLQDYRESDVAHATNNAFHAMHLALAAQAAPPGGDRARFVSLHGKGEEIAGDLEIHVSDGSTAMSEPMRVSSLLSDALVLAQVPETDVFRCQQEAAPTQGGDLLCGTTNLQGIAVNAPANACTDTTAGSTDRFLHIEQPPLFRQSQTGVLITALTSMQGDFDQCDLGADATDCAPELNHLVPLPNPNLTCQ